MPKLSPVPLVAELATKSCNDNTPLYYHNEVPEMPRLSPAPLIAEMEWPTAQQAVIDGKRITRLDWHDPSICVFMADGYLKIRKADGTLHALLVSDGDLLATDWVIVRET